MSVNKALIQLLQGTQFNVGLRPPEDKKVRVFNAKAQREMKAAKPASELLQEFSLRLGS
jgi:hypothetical protein